MARGCAGLYHESDVRSSTIASLQEAEGGQDGLMDLLGRPATDVRSTVQEDFHQPDDARLVDLDAGIALLADGDRQGDALQEWKVHVHRIMLLQNPNDWRSLTK